MLHKHLLYYCLAMALFCIDSGKSVVLEVTEVSVSVAKPKHHFSGAEVGAA
jgi:hypothetical protein